MALVRIPFIVEPNYQGWRLDRYLQEKLGRASRAKVQRIIRTSLVQEGERTLKPSSRVTAGLRITLEKQEAPEPDGLPTHLGVLHDDGRLLIVDKPAGLPVHPTARYFQGTVTTILGREYRDSEGRRPDPAHRIDRETSGALVCGRQPTVTRALKALFAQRSLEAAKTGRAGEAHMQAGGVRKDYLAIVEGAPDWEQRTIEHPMALTGEHQVRIRMSIVPPDHPRAQPASTRVKVLARFRALFDPRNPLDVPPLHAAQPTASTFALLACELLTGRQHQVRAHLHAEGFPLVGDKIYGPDESIFIRFTDGALTDEDHLRLRLPRHALHAWKLAFPHPVTGELVDVEAPLPLDMRDFLRELELITSSDSTLWSGPK